MTLVMDILVLTLVFLAMVTSLTQSAKEPKEYCQEEMFKAECEAEDEVVVMETARYGRMHIGRCVKRNLGYLGCVVNVLRLLDARCSGRRSCDVSLMDAELRETKPCLSDVTWHLEASFRCVKVHNVARRDCYQTSKAMLLSDSHGHLGSAVTSETRAGSEQCPWRIQASKGQKINVTLHNFMQFSAVKARKDKSFDTCYEVAIIRDGTASRPVTACRGDSRIRHAFISQGSAINITFLAAHDSVQFILSYQVVGCGELSVPPGVTTKRTGSTLTVQCARSGETWYLTCEGSAWSGQVGNCSASTGENAEPWMIGGLFTEDSAFPYGILIVVAVGVALGVFLGGTLLIIVSLYMKRRRRRRMAHAHYAETEGLASCHPVQTRDLEKMNMNYAIQKTRMDSTLSRVPTEVTSDGTDYGLSTATGIPTYTPDGSRLVHHVYESPAFPNQ